jgi:hypothetical protein
MMTSSGATGNVSSSGATGNVSSSGASGSSGNVVAPPINTDGKKSGDETDVDCGGSNPKKCADSKGCLKPADCTSSVCTTGVCQAPKYTDKVKNGAETDVDCGGDPGGPTGHPCAPGLKCKVGSDCDSTSCNYKGVCAAGKTCTLEHGGNTCGSGEFGDPMAKHEDCCMRIRVPAGKDGAPFVVDKYLITAGRMRSFLEAINGKVRSHIQAKKPTWWKDEWTPFLPDSWDGSDTPAESLLIGSTYGAVSASILENAPKSQGCQIPEGVGNAGHPTYYVPRDPHMKGGKMVDGAAKIFGQTYNRWMTQDALDEKPLNCTTYVMLAALCAYDGGQVISEAEYLFLYDNDGVYTTPETVSPYPWGSAPDVGGYGIVGGQFTKVGPGNVQTNTDKPCPACDDTYVNWFFSYQYPMPPMARPDANNDQTFFMSAPGRFPKGASRPIGGNPNARVQDIAGSMIHVLRDVAKRELVTLGFGTEDPGDDRQIMFDRQKWRGGSWEGHAIGSKWEAFSALSKYGKLDTRCVYPAK